MKSDSFSSVDSEMEEEGRGLGWWPLIGFAVALVIMLVPLPFHGRAAAAIGDIAHAPLFGFGSASLLFLWHRWRPLDQFGRQWTGRMALVAVCMFLVGVVIEFVQMMTGRTAAMHDVIANGLGIVAAVALSYAVLNSQYHDDRRWLSVLATATAMIMIGMALARPVRIVFDSLAVNNAFPMITSFETEMELTRWHYDDCRGEVSDGHVTDGESALRILVDQAPHPAATLIELVADWSDIQTLELDATLARSYPIEMELVLKVVDQDHANFDTDTSRKTFRLKPGEVTHLVMTRDEIVEGPDSRQLDLRRIKFVSLLMVAPQVATFVDVDRMMVTLP